MTIIFEITEQKISCMSTKEMVEKSQKYIDCRFDFTAEWDGMTKAAIFDVIGYDKPICKLLDSENKCPLPYIPESGICKVAVIGGNSTDIDNIVSGTQSAQGQIITTNIAVVNFDKTIPYSELINIEDINDPFANFLKEVDLKIKDIDNTFSDIKDFQNGIKLNNEEMQKQIGEIDNLETDNKTDLVSAINEINNKVGNVDLSGYATKEELGGKADKTDLGDLSNLNTQDTSNIVSAINELNSYMQENHTGVSDLFTMANTLEKNLTDEVNAREQADEDLSASISEMSREFNGTVQGVGSTFSQMLGALSSLNTNNKSNIVDAVNEVNDKVDNIDLSDCATKEELDDKTDKTAISKSDETAPTLVMNYNTEMRYGEVSSLSITLPQSFEDDYISSVVFTSGEAAVNLIYPESVKMSGEDCIDGVFTPVSNKRYTLILSYDGEYVSGIVGGVTI